MRREVAHAFAPWVERGAAELSDTVRTHVDAGRAIDAAAYLALLDAADALRRAFAAALKPYDAALTPSAPGAATRRPGLHRQPGADHALDPARRAGGQPAGFWS